MATARTRDSTTRAVQHAWDVELSAQRERERERGLSVTDRTTLLPRWKAPPTMPSKPKPVTIEDLAPGSRYRRRVLRGVIVSEEPLMLDKGGYAFLLADSRNELIRVEVPEWLSNSSYMERKATMRPFLGPGNHVAVIEPKCARRPDGTLCVAVKKWDTISLPVMETLVQPREEGRSSSDEDVGLWDSDDEGADADAESDQGGGQGGPRLDPRAALLLKAERRLLRDLTGQLNKPSGAGVARRDGPFTSLLLNCAACHLGAVPATGDAAIAAAAAAAVALALDPSSSKAFYRAALALNRLNQGSAAAWFMGRAADLAGSSPEARAHFMAQLSSTGSNCGGRIGGGAGSSRDEAVAQLLTVILAVATEPAGSGALDVLGDPPIAPPTSAAQEVAAMRAGKDQGNVLFQVGQLGAARAAYQAALRLQTREAFAEVLLRRANVALELAPLMREKRHAALGLAGRAGPAALLDAAAARVLVPRSPVPCYWLGVLLAQVGKLATATWAVERGLELSPGDARLLELLQVIQARSSGGRDHVGRTTRARDHREDPSSGSEDA